MHCGFVSAPAAAGQRLLWEYSAALNSGVRGLVAARRHPLDYSSEEDQAATDLSPCGRRPSLAGHQQCLPSAGVQ